MLGWVVGGFPSGYLPVPCGPGHSSVSVREAGAPARIPYSPAPMVPFLVRMAADRIGVLEVMAKGQTSVWVALRANSGELSVSPVLCVCVCPSGPWCVCVHLVFVVCVCPSGVLTVPWATLYTRLHRLVFSSGL